MNQQASESEIKKLLENLNYPSQADIMQQQLFFIQSETIRKQRISDERIVEALINVAANNPSFAARKEANKTLAYLGVTPPPVNPKMVISKPRMYNPLLGGVVGFLVSFPSLVLLIYVSGALFPKLDLGYWWMRSVFDQFGSLFSVVPLYMVGLAVISGLVTSRWGLKVGILSVLLINSASLLLK